jgi:hypothetical protein
MVRSIGAQLGLLAFGLAIVAGLYVGNSPVTILVRALVVMVVACAIGQVLGWAGKQVLREHLQKKKLAIDRQHLETIQALMQVGEPPAEPPLAEPQEAQQTEQVQAG